MSPYRMSSLESGIRAVLDFKEAFNQHNVPGIMQLVGNDCFLEHYHPAPDGTRYEGKAAISECWQGFFQRSPTAKLVAEDAFGFDYHCVMRWKHVWENEGGKEEHLRGVDVFKVKEGIIFEQYSYAKG